MKKFSRTKQSRLVSSAVLAVIIGALCFSVGEGLRLTPFPVPAQEQDAGVAVSNSVAGISLSQYGPLDVPTRAQKRTKRYPLDFAGHGSPVNRAAVSVSFSLPEDEAIEIASVLFVARPSGRAPPFKS